MIRPLSFFLALSLSLSAFGASLDEARLLVDQRRYGEAIPMYEVLLGERPGQADLLIEAGRVNAWADRHADAARLYRQAIAALEIKLSEDEVKRLEEPYQPHPIRGHS